MTVQEFISVFKDLLLYQNSFSFHEIDHEDKLQCMHKESFNNNSIDSCSRNFFVNFLLLRQQATVSPLQQQVFAQQVTEETEPGSVLKLARTNVPIDIPLLKGYENGNEIYFIATDVSDEKTAAFATNLTGFKVNYAPALAQTPDSAIAKHMHLLMELLATVHLDFRFQS